jgi:hypothetical protein
MQTLAGFCQDNTTKILTQGATLRSIKNLTGTIQQRQSEVEAANEANKRRIANTVDIINNLEIGHINTERCNKQLEEQLQQYRAAAAADGADPTGAADNCKTDIFVSRIQNFMVMFEMRPTTDPVTVAGRKLVHMGPSTLYVWLTRLFY